MKDLEDICKKNNIPLDYFRGSLGLFTIGESKKNPHFYQSSSPAVFEIVNNPIIYNANNPAKARSVYFNYLNSSPENPVVLIAALTQWIMVSSTVEKLREPAQIAFHNGYSEVTALVSLKIYCLDPDKDLNVEFDGKGLS